MKKIKKRTQNIFYIIISVLLVVSSISFLGFLLYIDVLPTKYLTILVLGVLFFNVLNIFLINLKKLNKKVKKIISTFIVIIILIMIIVSFYLGKTVDVLLNNVDSKYKLENYSVLVLKNSDYENLEDIENQNVGYFENSTGSKLSNSKLSKKVNINFKSYKTSDSLIHDLLDSKIEIIVIEDSIKNIMDEEISEFANSTKVIYTFSIKIEVEETIKEVDVTKEPFAIYVSGIDTYGEISSVSRSDVNIVMVVNPKTRQILLISIPRDYYVQLSGTTGTKDKLTHAGIYGIDMSIQTIEELLELDINYYIKVNFTSVIEIVDALGGLDVYSEYTFTSYSGYKFKKGLNSVNGKQALDFARTRKVFVDGDRQRGKNQQAIIEAIIRKATDKSIITKYSSLLNAINGKYQTNMSMKKITSLVKTQLEDMLPWTVNSYSLTGKDSVDYTYTYNQLLYVMKPDQESISGAIQLINKILDGEQLENSYDNIGGSSNKVTQVQVNTNQSNNKDNTDVNNTNDSDENKTDEEDQDLNQSDNNSSLEPDTEQSDSEKNPVVDKDDNSDEILDSEMDEDKDTNQDLGSNDSNEDPIEPIIPAPENQN